MESAPAPKVVIPNPRVPRTFGILNIVFSSLLLLCVLCNGAYFVMMIPAFSKAMDDMQKKAQEQQDNEKKAILSTLADEEKAARTDQEKVEIKAKRLEVES